MKKIEKEIKKNSTELIESSLPEIDSLDNIPVKTKTHKKWPLVFAPIGAVVLALTAILIPLALKDVAPLPKVPGTASASTNNGSKPGNNSNNNPGSNINNNNNNQPISHTYKFDFSDYRPTFDNFNEVAYYSYLAYEEASTTSLKNAPRNRINLKTTNEDVVALEEQEERSDYIDAYGRKHYPIPLQDEYTFSNFLFFEFESTNSVFLEERIGNGHIYGLVLDLSIFGEQMLILKNGEHYYSCLCNGAGNNGADNRWRIEFSAHKTIEGFDLVKDVTNKRYVTLTIEDMNDFTTLSHINVEGKYYYINPNSVHYDNIAITCSFEEIRERLELDPEYKVINGYGGNDTLVYDAESGNNTFTLEEFEGTFSVENEVILLDNAPVVTAPNVTTIYASEINKDFHRDLVFETVEGTTRCFNVYDVYNKKYLYRSDVYRIGEYSYYLDMKDERLVVKLFEPNMDNDAYLLDYGYFAYYRNRGVTIIWQNLFEITEMRLNGVFEADGITPVECVDTYYHFNSNTPYILEIKINKYPGYKNPDYPSVAEHPIACIPYANDDNTLISVPNISFLSMENDTYRYQIMFQKKGFSCYAFTFYRYSFDLRVAVDEPIEVE